MPSVGGWELTPSSFAFWMCMLVILVDMMGQQFCGPVLTPYGIFLGLTRRELGSLFSATAAGQVVSSFVLPALSDKKGRKVAVVVSAAGSFVAYFLQGLAHQWDYPSSYYVFLAAKGISGCFAGTLSVLTAYLTEISDGNYDLLKRRMTMMIMIQQQGGHLLGPVAGSIAVFGLYIPFFLASSAACLATPLLIVFFQNPDVVKARERELQVAVSDAPKVEVEEAPKAAAAPAKPKGLQSPFWMDPVLLLYCLCYSCLGVLAISLPPLLAFLLQYPSFGLLREDPAETQGAIAQVASLTALPQGALQSVTMLLVFPMLSKRIGGTKSGGLGLIALVAGMSGLAACALLGDDGSGSCGTTAMSAEPANFSNDAAFNGTVGLNLDSTGCEDDFLQVKIWMVCIAMGGVGIGMGMMIPLLLASGPKYRGIMYPDRLGACGAFCMRGIFAGMMLGGPLTLGIYEAVSLGMALTTVGVFGVFFFILFVLSDKLASSRLAAKQANVPTPVSKQRSSFQSNAMEETEFIAQAKQLLEDLLKERNYCAWSGPEQALVRAELHAAFPKLQPWSDQDGGFQHNVGVARQLRQLGEEDELQLLQDLAPGVSLAETGLYTGDGVFAMDPGVVMRQVSSNSGARGGNSGNRSPAYTSDMDRSGASDQDEEGI